MTLVNGCEHASNEVDYFIENFEQLNERFFVEKVPSYRLEIYGDASEVKAGGFLKHEGVKIPFSKYLPPEMLGESSTLRELYCLSLAIRLFDGSLKGETVLYVTDSQCTEIIMSKGSTKFKLHKLAAEIHQFCIIMNIKLIVAWVPRNHNAIADFYSKLEDFDDWALSDEFFQKVSTFSKCNFTLDCFASSENAKCHRYYSRWYDFDTLGVDSLKFSWEGEIVWVVAPPRIAVKALLHFQMCGCRGVFVLPRWTGQGYWALLQSEEFVKNTVSQFHFVGKKYILPGKSGNSAFKDFKGLLSVFLLDFS